VNHSEAGRKGGKACVKKHGRKHMKKIGRSGFDAVVARHFGGDAKAYAEYLRRKSTEYQIDALASIGDTSCIELPVILDPDDDPFF
jgi:general stress protein YciG